MWDYVRPDPCILQHARSYYSAGLLASIVGMYQKGIEQQRIQHDWLAVHEQHASAYRFHGWPEQLQPWWVAERNHQLMTDRRKLDCLLADYFGHFLSRPFERGLHDARAYLCYGLTTDETFKVKKACSILVEPAQPGRRPTYKDACVALHTLHSSPTQMVVGYALLLDKTALSRAELFQQVYEVQAAAPAADVVVTRFVSTDNPVNDESMLVAVHSRFFPGPFYRVDVGDDIWHVMNRVFQGLHSEAYRGVRASLLGVLQRGVVAAQVRALRIGVDWVSPKSERGRLTGAYCTLTVGMWRSICEWRMEEALDAWLEATAAGPQAELLGEAAHKVALAKRRLQFLFSFVEHARDLGVRGTTPNEKGHQSLNRRTKFITHMRPDHLKQLLLYHAYLHNHACAAKAVCNEHLPATVRERCVGMFPLSASVPLDAVGAEGRVPYIIPYRRPVRVYTQPEYDAEFGMHGGMVM